MRPNQPDGVRRELQARLTGRYAIGATSLCYRSAGAQDRERIAKLAAGFALQLLGEFFDFLGFLVHAHGQDIRGHRFLYFVPQIAGELIQAFDTGAKFLFVLQEQRLSCRILLGDLCATLSRILSFGGLRRVGHGPVSLSGQWRSQSGPKGAQCGQSDYKPAPCFAHRWPPEMHSERTSLIHVGEPSVTSYALTS